MHLHDIDWPKLINTLPFLGETVQTQKTPFTTKMVEAVVIALGSGLFSMWVMLPKMQEQIANVSQQVQINHQAVKEQIDKVSHDVEKISEHDEKVNDKQQQELEDIKRSLWKGLR